MNCKQVQQILSDYLEGFVSDLQKKEIEQHLQQCEQCQIELDELKKTVELLKNLPAPPVSEKLVESVMEKISTTGIRKRKFTLLLTGIACAEIIAFVVLFKLSQPVKIAYQPETKMKSAQTTVEEKKTEITPKTPVSREKKIAVISSKETEKQEKTEIVIQLAYLGQPQKVYEKRNSIKEKPTDIAMDTMETAQQKEIIMREPRIEKAESEDKKSQEIAKPLAARPVIKPEPVEQLSTESEIIKHIHAAGGKILSESPVSDTEISHVFVAEIPGSMYKNFLDHLAGTFQIKNYDSIKDVTISETFITIRLQLFR
ncbi:MAG TPA: zf-HC2 domain-containing protein [bacterium]|nr:zf-HC2 domain-containing protein [bacterium]